MRLYKCKMVDDRKKINYLLKSCLGSKRDVKIVILNNSCILGLEQKIVDDERRA